MSYILETPQKNKKSQPETTNKINPLAASAAADENWLEAKNSEKYRRNDKQTNTRAPRKQIFHPVDGLY